MNQIKPNEITKECSTHGLALHALRRNSRKETYYSCRQCATAATVLARQRQRRKLVEAFGGACQCCGYGKYIGGLEFHHVDEKTKEFGISKGWTISFDRAMREAKKCVLVCVLCHREIHAGLRECPQPLFKE